MTPNSYLYNASLAQTPEDNRTYARKRIYKVKECEDTLTPNNLEALWNCNLCGQDDAYYQPFVKGDIFSFQYRRDVPPGFVAYQIIDASTDEPIVNDDQTQIGLQPFLTIEEGQDEQATSFINVIVDTTNLPLDCWYLRTTLFNCEPDEELLEECITEQMNQGMNQEQAEFHCWTELCEGHIEEVLTEPFKLVKCERTIKIEGYYPKYDCDGNYYGEFVDDYFPTNSFKPIVRIPGEVVQDAYAFIETIVDEEKTGSKQTAKYKLLSQKLPPYVVAQLARIFNSKYVLIDDVKYLRGITLTKNNDEGQMWMLREDIFIDCEKIDFNCE